MNTATSDADMTEAASASTASTTTSAAAAAAPEDVMKGLISLARQLLDQGKPSQALQAVVMAMKTTGGEAAVFQILQRARELYRRKLQASVAADQLASLFAQCAIAEAHPAATTAQTISPSSPSISTPGNVPDVSATSILAETGRKQTVLDAFSDGSSFICLQCGGLVSVHRRDEHYAYWCQ